MTQINEQNPPNYVISNNLSETLACLIRSRLHSCDEDEQYLASVNGEYHLMVLNLFKRDYLDTIVHNNDVPFTIDKRVANQLDERMSLIHACMGISGEAGELTDAIKKHIYYGKPLDTENVVEELGDILFYCTAIMHLVGVSINEVMEYNIAKLNKRYNKGTFDAHDAQERKDKLEPMIPSQYLK